MPAEREPITKREFRSLEWRKGFWKNGALHAPDPHSTFKAPGAVSLARLIGKVTLLGSAQYTVLSCSR